MTGVKESKDSSPPDAGEPTGTGSDDGLLDSLGKAVAAPVEGAAEPEEPPSDPRKPPVPPG